MTNTFEFQIAVRNIQMTIVLNTRKTSEHYRISTVEDTDMTFYAQ